MQEKSTKPFQQKLDALTELPDGFSFDAAHSWNRMEEKLTGKQTKQKKVLWYMAAAASIAFIISIVYFNQQERIHPVTVKPEELKQEQSVIADSKSGEAVLNNETQKPSVISVITKTKTLPEKKPVEMPVVLQETKPPELIAQISTTQEMKPETTLPETTAIAPPLVATPVKRKIIHISELGKETFLKEQQTLSVKEEKTPTEVITEEPHPGTKPWYKKFKSTSRTNNN
ncbi:MAG: hypothetical protein K2X48_10130 [Chitinophagaceae bacterium]|nr:hypothetical protein [Chitinophagaceae bacterium]